MPARSPQSADREGIEDALGVRLSKDQSSRTLRPDGGAKLIVGVETTQGNPARWIAERAREGAGSQVGTQRLHRRRVGPVDANGDGEPVAKGGGNVIELLEVRRHDDG